MKTTTTTTKKPEYRTMTVAEIFEEFPYLNDEIKNRIIAGAIRQSRKRRIEKIKLFFRN